MQNYPFSVSSSPTSFNQPSQSVLHQHLTLLSHHLLNPSRPGHGQKEASSNSTEQRCHRQRGAANQAAFLLTCVSSLSILFYSARARTHTHVIHGCLSMHARQYTKYNNADNAPAPTRLLYHYTRGQRQPRQRQRKCWCWCRCRW
jgi:hypothetical protein